MNVRKLRMISLLAVGLYLIAFAFPQTEAHAAYKVDVVEFVNLYRQKVKDSTIMVRRMPMGLRISSRRAMGGSGKIQGVVIRSGNTIAITLDNSTDEGGFLIAATGYGTFDYEHIYGEGTFTVDLIEKNSGQMSPDRYKMIVTKKSVELVPISSSIFEPGYTKMIRTRAVCESTKKSTAKGSLNLECAWLTSVEVSISQKNDRMTETHQHIPGL